MIAVDNLGDDASPGDVIRCPKCHDDHVLIGADPPSALLAYRCGDGLFLAGIGGKLLAGVRR